MALSSLHILNILPFWPIIGVSEGNFEDWDDKYKIVKLATYKDDADIYMA